MNSFSGKKDIIHSLIPLIKKPRYVSIDKEEMTAFCSTLTIRHFRPTSWNSPAIYSGLDEKGVDYIMLMNALNFCYWGNPKWTVEYNGQQLDGAWGMFASLKRAIEEDIPIWKGEYLATITKANLAGILRGNVKIPLFEQRLSICREVGRILSRHFGGRFHRIVKLANGSAVKMVEMLITHFPSFDDSVQWKDHRFLFYKRAQLAPAMLHERWGGKEPGNFHDIPLLTVSADYKLPQILRRQGILKYSDALTLLIDEQRCIPAGSRKELEIRAATIRATEMMLAHLQPRLGAVTAQSLDRLLWLIGQKKSPEDKPYHRTLTTAY